MLISQRSVKLDIRKEILNIQLVSRVLSAINMVYILLALTFTTAPVIENAEAEITRSSSLGLS